MVGGEKGAEEDPVGAAIARRSRPPESPRREVQSPGSAQADHGDGGFSWGRGLRHDGFVFHPRPCLGYAREPRSSSRRMITRLKRPSPMLTLVKASASATSR